jgi:hypothetical protein
VKRIVSFAAGTKVLPDFFERSTKTLGGRKRTEAQHWVVPLFHPDDLALSGGLVR